MIRRIVTALIFLVFSFGLTIYGQNPKIESLRKDFKIAKHDTTRVKLLIEIGSLYINQKPDTAYFYFSKALALADSALASNSSSEERTLSTLSRLKSRSILNIGIVFYYQGNYNKAIEYYQNALKSFEELGNKMGIANCCNNIGLIYTNQGNYDLALELYLKALSISEEINDKPGIAARFNNISNVYYFQGNFEKALEYYLKSLKIREELGDKEGMIQCYGNIGIVHKNLGNYDKAIEYCLKSIVISEEIGNKRQISNCFNTLGTVYNEQRNYDKALEYYFKSLEIEIEFDSKREISQCYSNIGNIYRDKGSFDKAIDFHIKSLKLLKELSDKNGIANLYWNVASLYMAQSDLEVNNINSRTDKLQIALDYGHKSINLAQEINAIPIENGVADVLMKINEKPANYPEALKYAKVFIETKDSLFNESKNKEINGLQLNYERYKNLKEKAILEKDKIIIQEKAQKQNVIIISISICLGLLAILIIFILRRLQITRRQKRIIEETNLLLNEKNNEILEKSLELSQMNEEISVQRDNLELLNEELTQKNEEILAQSEEISTQRDNLELMNIEITLQHDQIARQHEDITASISYASRIQQAMLPPVQLLNELLPNHFIFYKPLDIVSGDFYWSKRIRNVVYLAVADCTGHGVPGAFMSMLGISQLNEIVTKNENRSPNFILNELRSSIKSSLHQEGQKGQTLDGMDIAFCSINMDNLVLEFSGANMPLYIIRRKEDESFFELIETKADNIPIGVHPRDYLEFTNHSINLEKDDRIYLFSDGFISQFGGDNSEKFNTSRFQETILKIQNSTIVEQKDLLENTLNEWKGKNDQIDDILVIGVNV